MHYFVRTLIVGKSSQIESVWEIASLGGRCSCHGTSIGGNADRLKCEERVTTVGQKEVEIEQFWKNRIITGIEP